MRNEFMTSRVSNVPIPTIVFRAEMLQVQSEIVSYFIICGMEASMEGIEHRFEYRFAKFDIPCTLQVSEQRHLYIQCVFHLCPVNALI